MRLVSYLCSITAVLGSLPSYPGHRISGGQSSELELLHTIIGKILLWIIYIILATYQPRGQPLGFDHSPKPLTVDFVKLCGLRMKMLVQHNNSNIYLYSIPNVSFMLLCPLYSFNKRPLTQIKLWTLNLNHWALTFKLYSNHNYNFCIYKLLQIFY